MLYVLGSRGRDRPQPLQAAAFFAGLLTIVIALDSPIDYYADQLFWVHMLQHILLLTVAPPLILLGRPWPRMWRALPLGPRTTVARTVARSPWIAPVRALARPLPAWILFNATFVAWHIPAAYDATLTSGTVHALEHAMFFFTGLLFWARVIDPGPLRPRLVWPTRIAYAAGAMVVGWMLAITLVLVPHPIYGYYAALADPARRDQRADRPAARRRRDVGPRIARLHDHVHDRLLSVARADQPPARVAPRSRPEED